MAYTTINKPSSYFNGATYLGSASAVTVSSLSFKPDFVWIKDRQNGNDHCLVDSVRGAGKYFSSNLTAQEVNSTTQSISSFTSTGFVTGTANPANEAASNTLGFMSWNWLASNTTTANTSGTISSTISVNQTAGFSIVSYTGNSSAGATIGHGLGVKPSWIITKQRSGDIAEPLVYHTSLGATKGIKLNTSDAPITNTTLWNDTEPTSTLFTVGTSAVTNASFPMIAYCFAEIKGYSKFGSYTGNGSTDGTFVYTGFKPAFVIIKQTSAAGEGWETADDVRSTYNVISTFLRANSAATESTNTDRQFDFLSNGIKMRGSHGSTNGSGATYIYMCFAENPFVSSTQIPTTAR
jgi:hypothetical protein